MERGVVDVLREAAAESYAKGWEAGWSAACMALRAIDVPPAPEGPRIWQEPNMAASESAGEHHYDSAVITSNAEQAMWQHEVAALFSGSRKEEQK